MFPPIAPYGTFAVVGRALDVSLASNPSSSVGKSQGVVVVAAAVDAVAVEAAAPESLDSLTGVQGRVELLKLSRQHLKQEEAVMVAAALAMEVVMVEAAEAVADAVVNSVLLLSTRLYLSSK